MTARVVTKRLEARVRRDFPAGSAERVLERLASLEPGVGDERALERIHAAVVLLAAGSWQAFERHAREAEIDWRDVLVAAGLEHEDWPVRLDDALGVDESEAAR